MRASFSLQSICAFKRQYARTPCSYLHVSFWTDIICVTLTFGWQRLDDDTKLGSAVAWPRVSPVCRFVGADGHAPSIQTVKVHNKQK